MEEAKKQGKKSVFKNLKVEFGKIIWLDKKTFIRQTSAVVASAVFLGLLIALLDFVIKYGMNFIL
ncbi:MAG: preprotein translocase subunit SecE [Lachnospiraceae bacterium]|nr:preprotein translocase subunit SecE [Lachnospiraceae bacterium]